MIQVHDKIVYQVMHDIISLENFRFYNKNDKIHGSRLTDINTNSSKPLFVK